MLERFTERFNVTFPGGVPDGSIIWPGDGKTEPSGYRSLMAKFGGATFDHGLYRLLRPEAVTHWTDVVSDAFPEYRQRIVCFGYDWLGRQFAVDSGRRDRGEALVLMLEPGTGEALEIPATLQEFHDVELVEYSDAALAADFFRRWQQAKRYPDVDRQQCAGYKVPLFLGGKDNESNLELIDVEVYWMICGQLRQGIRKLSPGTTIRSISIS